MVRKIFVILAILAIVPMYSQGQVLVESSSTVGISVSGPCQGGAWGDYDGDGDEDFALAIDGVGVKIFKNMGGTFSEVSDAIPTSICADANTVCWFDYDKDGDLDLIIGAVYAPGYIFRNDGADTFSDQTAALGIASDTELNNKFAITIADYDNDGYPDIFAAVFSASEGSNYLLKNVSGTGFTDVTPTVLQTLYSPRSGTAFDFNEDGLMDIYLATAGVNFLFRNDGGMSFTDVTAAPVSVIEYTAGICVADFDLDGDLDMCASKHLLRNDSSGGTSSWTDVTFTALSDISVDVISPVQFDYNNDGKVDIFVGELGAAGVPGHLFRNDGGMSFTETTLSDAPHMTTALGDGRGSSAADIDNDGDMDLYRSNGQLTGTAWIYLNGTNNSNWLKVKVVGVSSPTEGIGAKVKVFQAGTSTLLGYSQVLGQSGYESQNSLIQHFGVPSTGTYDVQVTFPSGTVQTKTSVSPTQTIEVWETGAPPTPTPVPLGVTTSWELYQ
jgi:hypothetical protein